MVIGIDGNEANTKIKVGIGRYAFEVMKNIYYLRRRNKFSDLSFQIYLRRKPSSDFPEETAYWNYKIFGSKGFWVEKDLMLRLWKEKITNQAPQIFWSPSHYAPYPNPIPTVISIMDLSFVRFPSYFKAKDLLQLKLWTGLSVKNAKKILTISNFSRKEIIDYYKLDSDKVVTTYLGFNQVLFNREVHKQKNKIDKVKEKYGIGSDYLLYLGTIQPRKNLNRLIQAFEILNKKFGHINLVLAGMISEGRGGWMYQEIFQTVEKLGLKKKVIFTGYIENNEMPYLLAGSFGLVLPSLYEGFGLPVVEAMACGTPVVISRNTSLEEIGGRVAIYIDNPYNIDSITIALMKLVSLTQSEKTQKIEEGYHWIKKFSWEKTATETLNTFISILKQL